jgi:hypothetical protein
VIDFGNFRVGTGAVNRCRPWMGNSASKARRKGQNLVSSLGGGGLSFPILNNPSAILGMLTGKVSDTPAELFRYDLEELRIGFHYGQSFPIFPGLLARIDGDLSATINLAFGFDTLGLQQFAAGGFDSTKSACCSTASSSRC